MWNKEVNLGEMVGNKHAFYSAMFLNDVENVLGYTYNGSFYLWKKAGMLYLNYLFFTY